MDCPKLLSNPLEDSALGELDLLITFCNDVQAAGEQISAEASFCPRFQAALKRCFLTTMYSTVFDSNHGKISVREKEERRTLISLLRLGALYANEMVICAEAEAKLSAVAMSCSLLETVLMISCLCYKERVLTTKAWQKAWKKSGRGNFVQTLQSRNVDITTLIEIGEDLTWFSSTIPDEIIKQFDPEELRILQSKTPSFKPLSTIAPSLGKEIRNMLHPGKHLREGQSVAIEESLQQGVGFMAIALCVFLLSHAE